jgi:Holliday junction resolvase RusA-like endonuclease
MMPALEFIVLGKPAPQGSKVKTRYGAIMESNKRLPGWRTAMVDAAVAAAEAAQWVTAQCPVTLEASFCFARPRSHYGSGRNTGSIKTSAPGMLHTQKPDGDKLARALFDALTIAGVVRDDSYIAQCQWVKWWGERDYMAVELWTV